MPKRAAASRDARNCRQEACKRLLSGVIALDGSPRNDGRGRGPQAAFVRFLS